MSIGDIAFHKNWLFQNKPALVAHRGYAEKFPENTLVALEAAVHAGAKFIEFDVQLSQDKTPFLIHDPSFERTAGIAASVFELPMSQISNISVGESARFGEKYSDEKPIALKALCEHLNRWSDVHSFIEIKRQSIDHFGMDVVVNSVLEAIDSLASAHTILSFRSDLIAEIKQRSDKQTGWVIPQWDDENLAILESLKPDFVFCNFEKIPEDQALPQSGDWVLYDISTAQGAAYCRQKGAHMIESMAVSSMLKLVCP